MINDFPQTSASPQSNSNLSATTSTSKLLGQHFSPVDLDHNVMPPRRKIMPIIKRLMFRPICRGINCLYCQLLQSNIQLTQLHIPLACSTIILLLLQLNSSSTLLHVALFLYVLLGALRKLESMLLYSPNEPPRSRLLCESPSQMSGFPEACWEEIWIDKNAYLAFSSSVQNVKCFRDGFGVSSNASVPHRIHAYLLKPPPPPFQTMQEDPNGGTAIATILFFHGNAGNIGNRLFNMRMLAERCHVNVLVFDYSGYGLSSGVGAPANESTLHDDATAVFNYLVEYRGRQLGDIDPTRIVLFGRSLGGAVAIRLAVNASLGCSPSGESSSSSSSLTTSGSATSSSLVDATIPCGLILENTFTSVSDCATYILSNASNIATGGSDATAGGGGVGVLGSLVACLPLRYLLANQLRSIDLIGRLRRTPTLFISGQNDELLGVGMMTRLYDRCPAQLRHLVRVAYGGHNDCWMKPGYFDAINNYLVNTTQLRRPSAHSAHAAFSSSAAQSFSANTHTNNTQIQSQASFASANHDNPEIMTGSHILDGSAGIHLTSSSSPISPAAHLINSVHIQMTPPS